VLNGRVGHSMLPCGTVDLPVGIVLRNTLQFKGGAGDQRMTKAHHVVGQGGSSNIVSSLPRPTLPAYRSASGILPRSVFRSTFPLVSEPNGVR
jgi:hypothetical protein